MDRLKQMLDTINVTYNERIFESDNGIAGLGQEPFVSKLIDKLISCPMRFCDVSFPSFPQDQSIRIHIIATYASRARSLLCEVVPFLSYSVTARSTVFWG